MKLLMFVLTIFSFNLFAQDIENGLLLLQDFGDNTFSKYLVKNPSTELQLYHDNKLIIEDYYDDIKDSLMVFKCNKSTLNFFKKNFKIKIDVNIN